MEIVKDLVSSSKYSIKCPYSMTPKYIVIHNTANDASAKNEISYMKNNNNEVSFHIAVDDVEARQGIPFDRNAWHAGDGGSGKGNRYGIAIEICYSKSGGDKFTKAEKNAAKLAAQLMHERGWDISHLKKHQDFSNKYCPHRTLDLGWDRFKKMVQSELNALSGSSSSNSTSSDETYKLVVSCKIYMNAANAKNRKSSVGTYSAGTYYVFNKSDGMINITKTKGVAGGWINPNDNKIASSSASTSFGSYYKKYTGSTDSIVTALNSIGVDSSYSNREKIAKANGISGYSGTASQNTKMLSLLKQGKLKKVGSTSSSNTTTTSYYKKYTGSSGSLVDALKAIGVNSSYDNRKSIAKKNGISNYEGSASQNEKLLLLLKQGKLKK